LGFNSLWLDEASTLGFASQSLGEIWGLMAGGDVHPPLFYWMEHFMLFFGDSEVILRLLPAIFGALTILLFYLVGSELLDRQTGLIAAVLLLISPFHIYYSQEARSYTMMLFFFTLSVWLYLLARKHNQINYWMLFAFASGVALYTHFYSFIPLVILILFEVVTEGQSMLKGDRQFMPFVVGVGIIVILSLPLLISGWGLFANRAGIGAVFGFTGISLVTTTIMYFSSKVALIAILFFLLFIIGLLGILMKRRSEAIFLSLLFITPLIIALLLAESIPMDPRYLITMILPFLIGIAASFTLLPEKIRSTPVLIACLLLLCVIQMPFLVGYYTNHSRNDWRGFSEIFMEITEQGDVIVLVPGYMNTPLNYYYSNATDGTIQYGATTRDDLEGLRKKHLNDRLLIIVTDDLNAADPSGRANGWLKENTLYQGSITGIHLFVG
jgi:uncharacterized membrane protein